TITPPLAYGSHKSKLIETLGKEPHAKRVTLSAEDKLRLVMWMDANAPYHDLFINKRASQPAYDLAADRALHANLKAIHERRCAGCHRPDEVTRLDWVNLRDAKQSLFLTAPLAQRSGGAGKCNGTVYADAQDADYRAAAELVGAAVKRAWKNPRRDLISLTAEAAPTRATLSRSSGRAAPEGRRFETVVPGKPSTRWRGETGRRAGGAG
ncbi:MAG: hypothetical protein N2689_13875, partial [Verrucomicrobiae bacterium]|nr:hypothetical protein [Verrucomicrobiae bacterium]